MTRMLIGLAGFLTIVTVLAAPSNDKEQKGTPKYRVYQLKSVKLDNPFYRYGLEKQLDHHQIVSRYSYSQKQNLMTIKLDNAVKPNKLQQLITKAGFSQNRLQAGT